ncbi:MAG: formate dehydrogenase subunit gamma [Gammaproteobacteria bacterium]
MARQAHSKPGPAQGVDQTRRRIRHRRIMMWSLVAILVGSIALPFSGYVYTAITSAHAATEQNSNPIANYWRAVREGDKGVTTADGPYATGVLIQNGGQNWRAVRNGPIASISPWIFAAVLLAIGLFYLIRGSMKVHATRSGEMVERWSMFERVLHWYTAILFIIMAITGLSLLFGRAALIPVFGLQGFAAYAEFAKDVHNYLGVPFMAGVIVEVAIWIRYNTPKAYDWDWLKRMGGMFSKDPSSHPHAGRANAGEKLWFWYIATFGLIGVCVSGLVMDFPNFGQGREVMQLANVIHATLAIIWIAISFGHIYLGSIGVEEAFHGMTKGVVSKEWMMQHHDQWYEEMQQKGTAGQTAGAQRPPASPGPAST